MENCLTAYIKDGKLYMRTKRTIKCKKQRESAEDLINSIKTRKIVVK